MNFKNLAKITRKQAVISHLLLSAVIFISLISLMYFKWYPGFLFDTDGGWQGLQLISAVDFILGPALTFIIFKPEKVGLKKDIIIIALIQLSSLFGGVWIVYNERPLAIVFSDYEYRPISHGSLEFVDKPLSVLDKIPGKIPKWIYLELPESREDRDLLRRKQFNDGPLALMVDRWLPYEENAHKIINFGWTIQDIIEKELASNKDSDIAQKIDDWLLIQNLTREDINIFDYTGRYKESYLMVEAKTAKVLGMIPGKLGRFYAKPPKLKKEEVAK